MRKREVKNALKKNKGNNNKKGAAHTEAYEAVL